MAAMSDAILPDPDFSCNEADPNHCRFIAGVRPYRKTAFVHALVRLRSLPAGL